MPTNFYLLTVEEVYEDAFIVEADSTEEAKRLLREGTGGERLNAPRFVRIAKITGCTKIESEKAARLLE